MLVMEDYPAARQLKGRIAISRNRLEKGGDCSGLADPWCRDDRRYCGLGGKRRATGAARCIDDRSATVRTSDEAGELALIIPPSMEEEIPAPVKRRAAEMAVTRPKQSLAVRADPLAPMPDDPQTAAVAEQARRRNRLGQHADFERNYRPDDRPDRLRLAARLPQRLRSAMACSR